MFLEHKYTLTYTVNGHSRTETFRGTAVAFEVWFSGFIGMSDNMRIEITKEQIHADRFRDYYGG